MSSNLQHDPTMTTKMATNNAQVSKKIVEPETTMMQTETQTTQQLEKENVTFKKIIESLQNENDMLKDDNKTLMERLSLTPNGANHNPTLAPSNGGGSSALLHRLVTSNEHNVNVIHSQQKESATKTNIIDTQLDDSVKKSDIIDSQQKEISNLIGIIHIQQEESLKKTELLDKRERQLVDEKRKSATKIQTLENEKQALAKENASYKSKLEKIKTELAKTNILTNAKSTVKENASDTPGHVTSMQVVPEKGSDDYTRYLEESFPVGTNVQYLSSDLETVLVETGTVSKVCKKTVCFTYLDKDGHHCTKKNISVDKLKVIDRTNDVHILPSTSA